MRSRYQILGMGIALWSVAASSSEIWAQFGNSTNHPVLTYLGRYHGVGYSQGYHACKTGNCKPVSQLYPAPSAPTLVAPLQTAPMARVPWPDLSGGIWNRYQTMLSSQSTSYSLHQTPDNGSSQAPQMNLFAPEPVRVVPNPAPSASPESPSDHNPRMQLLQTLEPLPAPK